MKDYYPSEKFRAAVDILAGSAKSVQERVADAFAYELLILTAPALLDTLPEDVGKKLREYDAAKSGLDDPTG